MKLTKKTVAMLLALLLIAVFFTACDPVISPDPSNSPEPSALKISTEYVDTWFLFGDLEHHRLTVSADGAWELRNPTAEDALGLIICEGTAKAVDGAVELYEKDGGKVGSISLAEDELTLTLTEDFNWLLEDYQAGALTFNREDDSVKIEDQNGFNEAAYQGYWQYPNGYVLKIEAHEWTLSDNGEIIQSGTVQYDEDAAYLMNSDGSSGGGKVSFDEDGWLVDVNGDKLIQMTR